MKRILITGAGSYVGTSVEKYMKAHGDYHIDTVDTKGDEWKKVDFSQYDVVYHVAGIAHVNADPKMEPLYWKVNRDLTIEIAHTAKEAGVKQFIFMSSQIVFHESKSLKSEMLTAETEPQPNGFYGGSKLEAEKGLEKINDDDDKNDDDNDGDDSTRRGASLDEGGKKNKNDDDDKNDNDDDDDNDGKNKSDGDGKGILTNTKTSLIDNHESLIDNACHRAPMKICILRPPMIYGPNSKGNFPRLMKLAKLTPIFPAWHNKRSMCYIDNLAEFVRQAIDRELEGVFYPQNREQSDTVEIIRFFAKDAGHKVWITRLLNPFVWLGSFVLQPINKMFATYYYSPEMSKYDFEYQLVSLEESLKKVAEAQQK